MKKVFLTWWWAKPLDKNNNYEKIGYVKEFKPYNWFIGTGEYIHDYEMQLKKILLEKINNIQYGTNGYIFVIDKIGLVLSHVNKRHIGTNKLHIKDKNGFMIVQEVIKTANKGDGYISYVGITNPRTGLNDKKTSFIKGYKKWNWAIGSGSYSSELENDIAIKRQKLKEQNQVLLNKTITIAVIAFIFLFIVSILFSNVIKNKFLKYKNKVEDKNEELENLNNNLEKIVLERTLELENTNTKLKETLDNLKVTKKDLISSEKMATLGELVSSITHEINTPLGLSITSVSHIQEETKRTKKLYLDQKMGEDDFNSFMSGCEELSQIVLINLDSVRKLANSFKSIAVDQALEEKREFNLKDYIKEILLALKSKTKKTNMEIIVSCDTNIILNSYPNYLFQIFTNFINNSINHGFEKNKKGTVNIDAKETNEHIQITYADNGVGIKEELKDNIFDQYFTTKRNNGGTGLGLHIVKKIVEEKLNGTIKIDENNNIGIKFIIVIPKR